MKKINYLFTLLLALVICGNAWGSATFTYTDKTSGQSTTTASIATAINNAQANSTIVLSGGTYYLDAVLDLDMRGCTLECNNPIYNYKNLTLRNGSIVAGSSFKSYLILLVNNSSGVLTLDNMVINAPSSSYAVYVDNTGGLVTIKGATTMTVSSGKNAIIYDRATGSALDISQAVLSNSTKFSLKSDTKLIIDAAGSWVQTPSTSITLVSNVQNKIELPNKTYDVGEVAAKTTSNIEISQGSFKKSIFSNKAAFESYVKSGLEATDCDPDYYSIAAVVENPVAQIGCIKYATFADALAGITEGCTMEILKDINHATDVTLTKSVTIDFKGHTIINSKHFYNKANNVTFTSSEGIGSYVNSGTNTYSIYQYNTNSVLNLENISISGGSNAIGSIGATNATINVKAGTTLSGKIVCGAYATNINNYIALTTSLFTGSAVTFTNTASGVVSVNASEISTNMINQGVVNIVDGYTSANFDFVNNSGTINILNGTFLGNSMSVNAGTLNIYGGLFSKAMYENGTHPIVPASGYKGAALTIGSDNLYRVVSNSENPSVQYGANQYYTINDALDNVADEASATFTLIGNSKFIRTTSIDGQRDITIDLNGHNINTDYSITIYSDNSLDIMGSGSVLATTALFYLKSAEQSDTTTQAKLYIGKDVTLDCEGNGDAVRVHPVEQNTDGKRHAYGVRVNIDGKTKSRLYIHVNIQENVENCPVFVLGEESETNGIYAAGYGRWTINGGTHNGTIAMRAGELTVNGGVFTNTDNTPVTFAPNYSGSAAYGSYNISLAQHMTKQPTMVTINGGTFSAVSPIAQGNPQENEESSAKLVKCYIKGGLFTSTNANQEILLSQEQNRIFASAGFYNTKPAAKCIATGYQAIPITNADYPTQYAAGYRWRIGLPEQKGTTETITTGNWKDASTWKEGVVPSDSVKAIIKHDVIVNTTAKAYGVSYESTGTLTVTDNGLLIVGKGLIADATVANFKVEGDGQLAILPETLCQPMATVEYVAKYAGKKKDITTVSSVDDVYWEQMAVPTIADLTMTEPDDCGGAHYYNTWDITEGWKAVQKADVKNSYTGYFLTNFSDYSVTAKNKAYTFTGKLAGNKINTLNFIREGYTFFGNSCLAPMSIPELLMELNTSDIQATVYVYKPLTSNYFTINMATVGRGGRPTEINKLQGFFIYAKKKTSAAPSYSDVIWNPLLAKLSMGAPARKAAMQSEFKAAATLTITSAKGWSDDVVLFEGENLTNEFDQNYDAQKMMGDYVNVYVPATQNMAVHAVADLENTPITVATTNEVAYTFTFTDLEGAQLELVDAETQTVTPMVEGGSYEFVAQANTTIAGRFSVRKTPGTATNIQTVGAEQAQKGIYTVMGQYLGEASMWDVLPTGVYVINGQKVVK